MRRLSVLAAGLLALGCSKAAETGPEAKFSAAAPNMESPAPAEGAPGTQLAAYAPADRSLSADLPDDGRVLFDGGRLRDGLNAGMVRANYGGGGTNYAGRLAGSTQGRAQYRQVPPPRGTTGAGLRPDAKAPDMPAGKAFALSDYERFEQAMYTTVYPVLTRMGWGARARRGAPTAQSPYRLTVHHTQGHMTHGEAETAQAVRGIQSFHMGPERGWADIGYHFLIDGSGRVAEGRPANVLGAHAAEANNGNLGISLMGDFNVQQPTDSQMDSLERLAAYLALRYDIPVMKTGYLEGHYHHSETDCPGRHLKARLAEIRAQVVEEEAKIRSKDDGAATLASFTPMVVTSRS